MISLSTMRELNERAMRLQMNIERKYERATRTTAILTGMPKGSGRRSKVEEGALKIVEIKEAYAELFRILEGMKEELKELLPSLKNHDDIGIMRLRYLNGHRPKDISEMVYLTERSVYYHLNKAEKELMRKYPDRVKK